MESEPDRCLESTNLYCCYYTNCGNEYTTKFNLKHHIESKHLKVKKFVCEICKKILSTKQNLKKHMSIHNGVNPSVCNYCGKSFKESYQIILHKRMHIKDGNNNISVAATSTILENLPCSKIKNFEKINWEEIGENYPKLPALQQNCVQEINLPSFDTLLKKCGKENRF